MQYTPVCRMARPQRLFRAIGTRSITTQASAEHLPRIAQPSIWSSVIPRFLRRNHPYPHEHGTGTAAASAPPSRFRQWLTNPSTSLIALALLTGSQAIQVLQLRHELDERRYVARRRADLLRSVLKRIQDGEDVDVAAELGTGDPVAEAEWKEMVDQIADERFWLLPKMPKDERNMLGKSMDRAPVDQEAQSAVDGQQRGEADSGQGETKFRSWNFWAETKEVPVTVEAQQPVVATATPPRRAFY